MVILCLYLAKVVSHFSSVLARNTSFVKHLSVSVTRSFFAQKRGNFSLHHANDKKHPLEANISTQPRKILTSIQNWFCSQKWMVYFTYYTFSLTKFLTIFFHLLIFGSVFDRSGIDFVPQKIGTCRNEHITWPVWTKGSSAF